MTLPKPEQFAEFYQAVYGYEPFPWQSRLAKRVCAGSWPRAIALPTAAGKTACIDIAVFALACRAKAAPRRIFFVVDRRVVVDQAKDHADQLREKLKGAKGGIVRDVALALRDIAHPGWRNLSEEEQKQVSPLDVYALRGGIYRETAWTRSPIQPTVITSTVDQVGSRLLFRGYGVSHSMKPVHAGLIGNDALILLDEAHCSRPFYQTMELVEKFRSPPWGEELTVPFRFVAITATPPKESAADVERDQADDRAHKILGPRIAAAKPAKLVVAEKATGKKKGRAELVKELARQASELMGQSLGKDKEGTEHFVRAVGVIVNRVATARELSAALRTDEAEVILLTGRMRPIDRDNVLKQLEPLFCGGSGELSKPVFVVATQCLEVGADLDFHALVTECASLDALRQRFGRLNRIASRPAAKAAVVIRADETEDTSEDPVYGESLAATWQWLKSNATDGTFDFGVAAVEKTKADHDLRSLNAPSLDAPTLLPAHLDCWVQTNPIPSFDPDPAPFLHGPKRTGQPDVQVVFRSDLGTDTDDWADIVSLCPPSSSEAVSVPIEVFRKWLAGEDEDESSDVEGEGKGDNDNKEEPINSSALRWLGPEKSSIVSQANEINPNQLYVVPCSVPGARTLGDFPPSIEDYAEEAFQRSRDKALLRLFDLVIPEDASSAEEVAVVDGAIRAMEENLTAGSPDWKKRAVEWLKEDRKRDVDRHPLGGFVITGKVRLRQFDPTYLDDGEPDDSFRGRAVSLREHSNGVAEHAKRFAKECGLDANLYYQAGLWHDLGKLDPRFQAMLKESSPRTAVGTPLAKSARPPRSKREREEARKIHRYPDRARHELLSAALVAKRTDDDLLLHLIATHHGSARPLANSVDDSDEAKAKVWTTKLFGMSFELPTYSQEIAAWNAELPERFWRVVRKLGWWGAAYYEAIFRLADHEQSRAEQETEASKPEGVTPPPFAPQGAPRTLYALPLPGLDGSNPLAFLAALGTLVVLDQLSRADDCLDWLKGDVALSWQRHTPVLHLAGPPPPPEPFTEFLLKKCSSTLDEHPARFAVSFIEGKASLGEKLREFALKSSAADRGGLDWAAAHLSELAEGATSQLLTVRRDYFPDNLRSILSRCRASHLVRALFHAWDYADGLDNQSLHWEPSEDRRHAYQWHMPSGDPTRKRQGGMLGANRLALEAWPLFPAFASGGRLVTRGFQGSGKDNTFWTWPLWRPPLTKDAVASMLGLLTVREKEFDPRSVRDFGVSAVFHLQRILVNKTPNFTTTLALA